MMFIRQALGQICKGITQPIGKTQTKYPLTGATVNGTYYDQGRATGIAIVDGKVVVVGYVNWRLSL